MKLQDYIKRVLASSKPTIETTHRKPVSRRELFAQGYLSMGGFVVAPSLVTSLFSRQAYGADCVGVGAAVDSGMMPFLCVDLGGGANIPGANVIVGDRGGQMSFLPDGSYASLGLAPESEPKNVSIENALGLGFHPESRIYQGIMSVLAPENAVSVDGSVFCTSSGDDTRNNPHNPTYWIAQAGAKGNVVSIVGTEDSVSGGRAMAPEESVDPALRPALVQNPEDGIGLVVPGILADMVGQGGIEKIMKFTNGMSARQLAKFNKLTMQDQTKEILKCIFPNAIDQVTKYSAEDLDPNQDPIISGVYDMNNRDDAKAGAIAKVLLDGYAGSGTITMGGYDYHGNARANTDTRDLNAGVKIGQFLEAAARKGKSAAVYCYTDGGVACRTATPDPNTPGRFNPSSDSGQRSAAFMLVYNANEGRTGILRVADRRQLGGFKPSGGVDNDAMLTSNSVVNLTKAIVANYMALHGKEGDLEKAIGRSPFGADLDQYLMFGKIK